MDTVSRYRWVILTLTFVGQSSNALAGQAIAPLAPLFQPELGLTKSEVGFFSVAVYIGAWCVLLVSGLATDRLGVRRMVCLGQLVTGVLLVTMALVGSFFQALLVMFLAGMGRGLTAPGLSKAIMDWFPPNARGTAMGIKQTSVPIGGIITASTLPALGLAFGWRIAIAFAGVVIIANALVNAALYRDPSSPSQSSVRRPDMRVGLGEVIRSRPLWVVSLVAGVFSMVQVALQTYLALYFSEVVLVDSVPDEATRIVMAGGYLAFCQVGGVVARVFWGVISDRFFRNWRMAVLAIIGIVATLVSLPMALCGAGSPLWLMTAIVFVYGATVIGWGGLYLAMAVETAGKRHAGTGVGFSMTVMQFGNVAGAPAFGLIVDATGSYQPAWLFLGGLTALGTLLAVSTLGDRKRGT